MAIKSGKNLATAGRPRKGAVAAPALVYEEYPDRVSYAPAGSPYLAIAGGKPEFQATSPTSNTIGTGTKTFTAQPGKSFTAGRRAVALINGQPANYMEGDIVSYDATTGRLVIAIDQVSGSGTSTDWVIYQHALQGVAYQNIIRVNPVTFPNDTLITSQWPNDADSGALGFNQITRGNYNGGVPAVPTAPVRLNEIAQATHNVTWAWVSGDPQNANVLDGWYVTTAAGDETAKAAQIGLYLHAPAETVSFHAAGRQIGTYTDEHGRGWKVAQQPTGDAGNFIMLIRTNNSDVTSTTLDLRRLMFWLVEKNEISGNTWLNGTAVGVEPLAGTTSVRFDTFEAVQTGLAAGTPGAILRLAVAGQTASSLTLSFEELAANVTGYEYRVNGGAWATLSGDKTITGLSGAVSLQVRGVNGAQTGAASAAVSAVLASEETPILPASMLEIPPTLIAPWEPPINLASSSARAFLKGEVQPEDHVLVRRSQLSEFPATAQIKFEDGDRLRFEGIDTGGHEISCRARSHVALIGCRGEYAATIEKDAFATGSVSNGNGKTDESGAEPERPRPLMQWCRFTGLHSTDKSHWVVASDATSGDNVGNLSKIERIGTNPLRFRFTFNALSGSSEAFPSPPLPGSTGTISPAKRCSVSGSSLDGVKGFLQGFDWSYQLDKKVSALVYEGAISASHKSNALRWTADTRLIPGVGGAGTTATGGKMWLYHATPFQHADGIQVEDGRPVLETVIENCVFGGSYQTPGNLGSPGKPIAMRNVFAFHEAIAPQDPIATQMLYFKTADASGNPAAASFDNVYYKMKLGRNIEDFGNYADKKPPHTIAYVNGKRTVTYTGLWTGTCIDGEPDIDFAPLAYIGANWDRANANYPAKTPVGPGSITDISIAWDALSAGMASGARLGIINVAHTTEFEVFRVSFVSHGPNAATRIMGWSATAATNVLTTTGKIRRGLRRGTAALVSGATYTFRLRVEPEDHPELAFEKDFSVTIP